MTSEAMTEREIDDEVIEALENGFHEVINTQAGKEDGITAVECAYSLLATAVDLIEADEEDWNEFLVEALHEMIAFKSSYITEEQMLDGIEFTGTMQ